MEPKLFTVPQTFHALFICKSCLSEAVNQEQIVLCSRYFIISLSLFSLLMIHMQMISPIPDPIKKLLKKNTFLSHSDLVDNDSFTSCCTLKLPGCFSELSLALIFRNHCQLFIKYLEILVYYLSLFIVEFWFVMFSIHMI